MERETNTIMKNYKNKIETLKELLELLENGYFDDYFKGKDNEFDGCQDLAIKNFLECRIIELETDKSY